ncbi:MAG: dTMP kinase [Nitrospirae bacterium]|nr:dTMP kinase [Nitrospirota bacterium]MBF0540824.1 dTMP kinase [Nitrospirota bacterium]
MQMFISFEGTEGAGKTTQISNVSRELISLGYKVLKTHEPGGTLIGEEIRGILLNSNNTAMEPITELLLYNAARNQHIKEKIIPALKDNIIVLTDRFSDSTIAYQGYGRGIDLDIIMALDNIATMGLRPDITFLLDIEDIDVGLKRNLEIKKTDRFELEEIEFHKKVRAGFLKIAEREPSRFIILDGKMPLIELSNKIINIIKERLNVIK